MAGRVDHYPQHIVRIPSATKQAARHGGVIESDGGGMPVKD
jgi:hypothetical protein